MARRSSWLQKDLRDRTKLDDAALVAVLARALDKSKEYGEEARVRAVAAALLARGCYRSAQALSTVLATKRDNSGAL